MQHYNYKDDQYWGFICGTISGFGRWLYLQIVLPGPQWSHLVEAGGTALICGFLGAAGTHLYKWIIRAWKEWKRK